MAFRVPIVAGATPLEIAKMPADPLSFRDWLDQQEDELSAIEGELEVDRATALTLLLLMRISGDLKDVEEWEA